MARLKLPIHKPGRLQPYSGAGKRCFWHTKSKGPYKWADPCEPDAYPWIQFLGYEIRYDGAVRVRPSSINKELTKQVHVTGRLLNSLQSGNFPNIRRSPAAIIRSFRLKLISMGIGRRNSGQALNGPMPKCWANGFRWLWGKDVLTNNLRALDRQRERQISRVVRRLKGLEIPEGAERRQKCHGFPFSYVAQFKRQEAQPPKG